MTRKQLMLWIRRVFPKRIRAVRLRKQSSVVDRLARTAIWIMMTLIQLWKSRRAYWRSSKCFIWGVLRRGFRRPRRVQAPITARCLWFTSRAQRDPTTRRHTWWHSMTARHSNRCLILAVEAKTLGCLTQLRPLKRRMCARKTARKHTISRRAESI